MKVLLLDGYNLIYRAKYSFKQGEYSTIYSFFRSLRPLIEKFDPDLAYFVVEGYPQDRHEAYPEYKATRVRDVDESFKEQKDEIISMLKSLFPIAVCRHPLHEGDDVIGNLVRYRHVADECIVVSSDTDFLQLYNTCKNVLIYNPIRKEVLPKPKYDYVTWKALKGDASDNIKGIRGIGDKRADALVSDTSKLTAFLEANTHHREILDRNLNLIRFADLSEQLDVLEVALPCINWDEIREKFEKMGFDSITNQKSWLKFQHTFAKLEKSILV